MSAHALQLRSMQAKIERGAPASVSVSSSPSSSSMSVNRSINTPASRTPASSSLTAYSSSPVKDAATSTLPYSYTISSSSSSPSSSTDVYQLTGVSAPSFSTTGAMDNTHANTKNATRYSSSSTLSAPSPHSPSSSSSSSSSDISSSSRVSSSSFSSLSSSSSSPTRFITESMHSYRAPSSQDYATRFLEGGSLPKPSSSVTLSLAAAGAVANEYERRGLIKPRGPRRVLPNLQQSAMTMMSLRPEQHSGQLWMRLNPSHVAFPMITENQMNFNTDTSILSKDFIPNPPDFKLKVENKEYKEQEQKMKQYDAHGVHQSGKAFSHAKSITV